MKYLCDRLARHSNRSPRGIILHILEGSLLKLLVEALCLIDAYAWR